MTAPDLFPANMESLLGGMEEAGETQGGESGQTGVTNSDTSNIKESSKDSGK